MDLDFLDLEEFSQDISQDRPTERPVVDHHDQLENRRKYLFIFYLLY